MAEVHGLAGPRSPCPSCGATQRLSGYADETIRNHRYGIAVLIACGCQRGHLRQAARSLLLPGQRRLHFAKERDQRRRTILSMIASLPVSAVYAAERGDSPILWLADAVAWAAGAKRDWQPAWRVRREPAVFGAEPSAHPTDSTNVKCTADIHIDRQRGAHRLLHTPGAAGSSEPGPIYLRCARPFDHLHDVDRRREHLLALRRLAVQKDCSPELARLLATKDRR